MMKKLGLLLIAFSIFSATAMAIEPVFDPTLEQQRNEAQLDAAYQVFLIQHPDVGCPDNCAVDLAARSQLTASLTVAGDIEDAGDTFFATSSVTNVGTVPAYYVLGYLSADELKGLPAGWVINNNNGDNFVVWNKIMPGETKSFTFEVTRDAQDGTIVFKAMAENCVKATSERVKVPVNPVVLGGIAASMMGMYAVSRRRKQLI